jgi:hypothetical protein
VYTKALPATGGLPPHQKTTMRHIVPAALSLLLPALAIAQTPACFSLNDLNTNVSSAITAYGFTGQNTVAWQITPASTLVVQAAQIYTRNSLLAGDRFMILEIWDDVAGLPGTRIAGGAWRIVNARPYAWQGANLDQLAILQANAPVWLVWREPGSSTPPEEPGGITTPKARLSGTTWSLLATQTAPKVRLFCNQLDDTNTAPFGSGCTLSTGATSTVFTNEQPTLGSTSFFFETSGNPNGAPVFLVLGFDPSWVPAPVPGFPAGCLQNTDVFATSFVLAGTGTTRGPTCAGYASLYLTLPTDPAFAGFLIAAQAVPYDAAATAPLPFATSNAQRITLL